MKAGKTHLMRKGLKTISFKVIFHKTKSFKQCKKDIGEASFETMWLKDPPNGSQSERFLKRKLENCLILKVVCSILQSGLNLKV